MREADLILTDLGDPPRELWRVWVMNPLDVPAGVASRNVKVRTSDGFVKIALVFAPIMNSVQEAQHVTLETATHRIN